MKNNKLFEIYQIILQFLKKSWDLIKKKVDEFDTAFPNTSQNIQLTFIYFFALVDLLYSILNNVFALGYVPEILTPILPIIKGILLSPILRVWASPEKVFFMSYVVLEFLIIRSALKLSKFVKYNILLVFACLMVQGLAISVWDVLFNREVVANIVNWSYDDGMIVGTNRKLAVSFFFLTFVIFLFIYGHFYSNALKGKIATLPGLYWLTDSVAFWLKIKTPTMKRFGRGKKKKKNPEDNK